MKSKFDVYLGRIKSYDQQIIEKTVEIRGGGTRTTGTNVIVSPDQPSSGSEGNLWFDTDDNTLYIYANGAWVAISGGTPAGGTFDFIDGTEFEFVDTTYFDFIA